MKEKALEYLAQKKYSALKEMLTNMNPADIAILFEELEIREIPLVFRLMPKELAADTFTYMDSDKQMHLINSFSDNELHDVLNQLFLDDTVDIIEEMPANVVNRILRNSDANTRKLINEMLAYPEDSAGSIMTVEYIYLEKDMNVAEAFKKIRSLGVVKETIYTCYVVESRKLIGMVTVKDLLIADEDCIIEDIMETNLIYVNTHDDKEDVAKQFTKYDFMAIPVVDNEQRLVGIITFDDAMDVIEDETTEDFSKMAAIQPSEDSYFKTSVPVHAKNRIGWLLILMFSSIITGQITTKFESQISSVPLLVSFMPMLMNTGGNCGSQSSAMVIRGLAVEEIKIKDFFKVLFKEFRIALVCCIVLSLANGIRILLQYRDLKIAAVVSLSLIGTVILAKCIGGMLPMIAKRLNIDPAIMSAPILSTVVDMCSITIYFNIAVKILNI